MIHLSKKTSVLLGLCIFYVVLVFGFQNCGPKFQTQQNFSVEDLSAIRANPIEDSEWNLSSQVVKQSQDIKVTIKLTDAAKEKIHFAFTTIEESAKEFEDFVPQSGSIVIEPGQDSAEIIIPTLAYSEKINSLQFSIEVLQKSNKKLALTILPAFKKMSKFKKLTYAWANPGYCGITDLDTVVCFGGIRGLENNQGLWGATDQYGSVDMGISDAIDIEGGGAGYCALTRDKKIYCWGSSGGNYQTRMTVNEMNFFPGIQVKEITEFHDPWGANSPGRICILSVANELRCTVYQGQEMENVVNRGVVKQVRRGLILWPNGEVETTNGASPVTDADELLSDLSGNDFFYKDREGNIRCGSALYTESSQTNLTQFSGATFFSGTCAPSSSIIKGSVLIDQKLFTYSKSSREEPFVLVPDSRGYNIKNVFGNCFILNDDRVVCHERTIQASAGPRIGMSQLPYDFRSLKDYKIKSVSGACFLTQENIVRCNFQNPTPVDQLGDTKVIKLVAARYPSQSSFYNCALTNEGAVKCWTYSTLMGEVYNVHTQQSSILGAKDISISTPTTALGSRTCIVTNNNGVECWSIGGATTTTRLTQVKKIAVGFENNVCGITFDQKIACETNDGVQFLTGLSDLDQVIDLEIMGNFSIFAVLATGQIKAWQGVNPRSGFDSLANIENIEVGNFHACALAKSGQVYCWGENAYGQFGNNVKTFYKGNTDPNPLLPTLAFNGQLAESIHAGATWTAIVPKKGATLRAAGVLWNSKLLEMAEVFDYTP